MMTERRGNEPVTRTSQRRRTLANITNLSLSASWVSNPREGHIAKTPSKSGSYLESQLHQEIIALKRLLAERDATIETQAAEVDQIQKEFLVQLRRYREVNEELISYNSRLSKDGGQLRDQLRLLQHEYSQMTVAHRINQNELQLKLAESQELLARLLEQADKSSTGRASPTKIHKQQRSGSTQRRRSVPTVNIVIEEDWNASSRLDSRRQEDSTRRSDLSRRSSSVSKETTSGPRPTRQLADNPPAVAQRRTPSTNLYGDLIGLDPMPEGSCEDDNDSPRESTSEEASSNTGDESWKSEKSGSGLTRESAAGDESWKSGQSGSVTTESTSRGRKSSSSESGDESWKSETPGSGFTRESTCRGRKSSSSESASSGRRPSAQFGNNTSKVNPSVSSSATRSVPVMHFSRRVPVDSSLSAENGRPLRRAVVKVASYTEPPLNTKMRRPD